MGILTCGIYMITTGIGVLAVYTILPRKRKRELMNYINSLSE